MTRSFRLIMVALLVLVMTQVAFAAGINTPERPRKMLERPTVEFDRAGHIQQMTALQQRLAHSRVELAATAPLTVEIPVRELRAVRDGVTMQKKMRVGVAKEINVPMTFNRARFSANRASLHEAFGAIRGRDDGGFDWSGVVRSPEASAMRIHFTDFDLPAGAELYVYNESGMAFGPYTGSGPNGTGEFWSNTVTGSDVVIQLHAAASAAPAFTISGVGHLTPEFALARHLVPQPQAGSTPCSFNAPCVVDAACVSTNSAVNTASNAVAHILFVSGAYWYICTGGLIADSDTSTDVPYFLTANHCISKASEASSMETFFFYKATTCGGCQAPGAANTVGASIVASNRSSDYTLMRLSQNAPSGAAFLGWNATEIAFTNNTPLFRLSHPQGAPQSYSTHVVDTSKGTCRSWPRGGWIYSRDVLGATEGGSSGSPVVNAAGEVVGQLSGGCGFNVNDVCDTASNATVDGAFAAYYSSVASILGSGGTGGGGGGGCVDNDGDGYCVEDGDCNDNNASINPGANDTKGRNGRNGIDNDCDGVIDG